MVGLPNEAAATGSLQFLPRPNQPTYETGEIWLHIFYQNSVLLFFNLCPSPRMKRVPLFLMAHVLIVKGQAIAKASTVAARDEAQTYRFFRDGPALNHVLRAMSGWFWETQPKLAAPVHLRKYLFLTGKTVIE